MTAPSSSPTSPSTLTATTTRRPQPNILITGTPGTGKTTTAELIAAACDLRHFDTGAVVKEHGFVCGRDEQWDTFVLDEDKLLDHMEPLLSAEPGWVVDYHSSSLFPERWFDLVLVLRTPSTTILYDRLAKRAYTPAKIRENVECEIMEVAVEEARESYREEIVVVVESECVEDMERNVERVEAWVEAWRESMGAE